MGFNFHSKPFICIWLRDFCLFFSMVGDLSLYSLRLNFLLIFSMKITIPFFPFVNNNNLFHDVFMFLSICRNTLRHKFECVFFFTENFQCEMKLQKKEWMKNYDIWPTNWCMYFVFFFVVNVSSVAPALTKYFEIIHINTRICWRV